MVHLRPYRLTPEKKEEVLRNLAAFGGNMSKACEEAGVKTHTVYKFLRKDTDSARIFKLQVEEARMEGVERLEDEARRRALDGWDEPVYYQGEECGVIRKYSNTLLIFLIKGHKKMYVDRYEVTGSDGQPIQYTGINANINVNTTVSLKDLTKDELEGLQKIANSVTTRAIES